MGTAQSSGFAVTSIVTLALPSLALGQASVVGIARDLTGELLPGVVVEAASPALMEQARSVTTDGAGQYRIADLRPGTYSVTFTHSGFRTVRREGIELSGLLTTVIDADMREGVPEDTAGVIGPAIGLDVRNSQQQRVLSKEMIDLVPTGRTIVNLAVLIPGMQLSTATSGESQDVGGSTGDLTQALAIHGSRGGDMRRIVDGLPMQSHLPSGSAFAANGGMIHDITVDIAAGQAEQSAGGVRMHILPREGGNTFSASLFVTGADERVQSDNIDQTLRARRIVSASSLLRTWEINPSAGGPLRRDRLWFFASGRASEVSTLVPGMVRNANAGNANSFTYAPDDRYRGSRDTRWRSVNGRVTWRANRSHRIGLFVDLHDRCSCIDARALTSPESSADYRFPWNRLVTVTYAAPVANQILLEAAVADKPENWGYFTHAGREQDEQLVGITDLATGVAYRGPRSYFGSSMRFRASLRDRNWRGAVSYITGAHAMKIGYQDHAGRTRGHYNLPVANNLSYAFISGAPVSITERAPYTSETHVRDGGLYVQDRWTWNRMTMDVGVRWDFYRTEHPTEILGPTLYTPGRHITFPAADLARLNDVMPRLGAVLDLSGTGRTALRASLSKYVEQLTYSGTWGDSANPAQRTVHVVTRQWNDANSNFAPDCDLAVPLANGECLQVSDLGFGGPAPGTTYDPDVLVGWGKRGYNWEGSVGVQHAVLPKVSVDVAYVRRWYGNFLVTDNRALAASDFSAFSVATPRDARLPEGGGQTIAGLYNVTPGAFTRRPDNYLTFASAYGDQIENWQGVDLGVDARPGRGAMLRGGLSTGRRLTDSCQVRARVPELNLLNPYCRVEEPYLAQIKLLGAYTFHRLGVLMAGTFQSLPGPVVQAAVVYSASTLTSSLGRSFVGGAAAIVNVIPPAAVRGDRLNQFDLRVGKIVRVGRLRATFNVDLFNALNANAVLAENAAFAAFRQPLSVLNPRLLKFSMQIEL